MAGTRRERVGRHLSFIVPPCTPSPRIRAPSHARPLAFTDNSVHGRSEEHTSELQSLMRISYAVFCLKKKKTKRATYTRESNNMSKTQSTKHAMHRTTKSL